ncbi:hypothetical protein CYMTET_49640 [Cymbomonas tetramitiformis]|uniref:Receptor ligand binding region domain-containing protein n=1 Tax=Cymbomonas tetramitiformis TaxID=36881 RepID=A0AAE0BPP6_9CHLO|nr:hypothetical protein CYMTET_49640 [Cymbomonas tetramitiformis]
MKGAATNPRWLHPLPSGTGVQKGYANADAARFSGEHSSSTLNCETVASYKQVAPNCTGYPCLHNLRGDRTTSSTTAEDVFLSTSRSMLAEEELNPEEAGLVIKKRFRIGLLSDMFTYGTPYVGGDEVAAVSLAVREINTDPDLLPRVHLEFSVQDSKCDEARTTSAAIIMEQQGAQVVLGASCSRASKQANEVLSYYSIPQISAFASSPVFSAHTTSHEVNDTSQEEEDPYPYFLRTVPSDSITARGMAELVHHYNWTTVATIAVNDVYGMESIRVFHEDAKALGITIATEVHYEPGTEDFTELVQELRQSHVYIFVVFSFSDEMARIMEQAYSAFLGGDGYVWIMDPNSLMDLQLHLSEDLSEEQKDAMLRGCLSLEKFVNTTAPVYASFLERWRAQNDTIDEASGWCDPAVDAAGEPLWMRYDVDTDYSTYDACIGKNYSRAALSTPVINMYDATYVVARALHEVLLTSNASLEEIRRPQILEAMLAQSFTGVTGSLAFDSAGDRSTGLEYIVWNLVGSGAPQQVGQWAPGRGFHFCENVSESCSPVRWSTEDNVPPMHSKYMIIGTAVFSSLSDGTWYGSSGYPWLPAIHMALDEINSNRNLLRDTRLVSVHQDDKCDNYDVGANAAFALAQDGATVVIGTGCSESSLGVQDFLRYFNIPQISGAATTGVFSPDSTQPEDPFPWFMRTAASDSDQSLVMAEVVQHFGWVRVVTVARDDSYGREGIKAFEAEARARGINIAASLILPTDTSDFTDVVDALMGIRVYIIVVYAYYYELGQLLEQAYAKGVGGDGFVWLGSESTAIAATWESGMSSSLSEADKNQIMQGYLGVRLFTNTTTPEYMSFLERWKTQPDTFDEASGWCDPTVDIVGTPIWMRYDVDDDLSTYDGCAGYDFGETITFEGQALTFALTFYDATYVVARALHQLQLSNQSLSDLSGEVLLQAMLNQSFAGTSGEVAFNSAGDRVGGVHYEVMNHAGNSSLHSVGLWSSRGELQSLEDESIRWSTGAAEASDPREDLRDVSHVPCVGGLGRLADTADVTGRSGEAGGHCGCDRAERGGWPALRM